MGAYDYYNGRGGPPVEMTCGSNRRRLRRKAYGRPTAQNLIESALDLGWTGDTSDLQGMADFCWDRHPSDGMGEMLEDLAAQGLIRAPW